MALFKGICHPIIVIGNLEKTNKISLKLPFQDISNNLWQISITQIAQNFNKVCKKLCGISCNFVTDIKYNSQKQVVSHCPILWQCLFNGNRGDKKIISFEKSWFYLTTNQEEIILQFHPYVDGQIKDDELINLDCDVFVTLLIQRVK